MEKKDSTPLWVFLAFSSINTRKGALILIWSCMVFTFYCVPWPLFFEQAWVKQVFLIDDWEWLAMMVPMILWYYLSLRWVDKHNEWES
jgi:hypothetical protein